ncbi:MAG: MBL fold metallo-hydrolase [Actinomycetota bacterium]|nr:MBL fold metallo-hydrolase [Actinomycetota bacterium]
MQITHFGHSCVLLDTGSARLLIDPGAWSEGFESVTGLDAVLITHQHVDHLDGKRLPTLLRGNPGARLIVDSGSAAQLSGHDHEVAAPGVTLQVAGARVDVLGGDHAVIYPDVPMIPNNAYLVDGTYLHPGDSFTPPSGQVEVLFVPTAAPWLKIAEAIEYLHAVAPRTAVPIHQAVLSAPGQQVHYRLLDSLGPPQTTVRVLDHGDSTTL